MNPQTIGKIDRHLGKPICWMLTVIRKIAQLIFRQTDAGPVRRVLFIKMIEQGATVLAYRALQEAVDRVGRENVYFWVFDENRPILDLLNVIPHENVIVVRSQKPVRLLLDMLLTLWRVRKMKFDACVDMEFYSRASAILGYLSNATKRVGLHRFTAEGPYRGDLLTHRVQYNSYLHVAIQYHQLVLAIWMTPDSTPMLKVPAPLLDTGVYAPPRFKANSKDIITVRSIIAGLMGRDAGEQIILLNPNASDLLPLRKWSTDRFVALGKRLLEEHPDAIIAITGAPAEKDAAQSIAHEISTDRAVSLAGHTTLEQLMVLYCISSILVTNDSGPGHFSSMTTVDSVVLFGPETPLLFGPLGSNSHVIWAGISCSPCVNAVNHRFSPCDNNVCMQDISVGQVLAEVNRILHRRSTNAKALPVLAGVS